MSDFAVLVRRLRAVEPHPNADRLDLAVIGDYRCVVQKGRYQAGDLVAYIPEGSLLPEAVLEKLNLKGSTLLAGTAHNRVKALFLREQLSQGICYPVEPDWVEGQDVTEILGVTKYVPPIPQEMDGLVVAVGTGHTISYDINNIKDYPGVLTEKDLVLFTEKLHGTWTCVGVLPFPLVDYPGVSDVLISSKGHSEKGIVFQIVPENDNNIYIRAARRYQIAERVKAQLGHLLAQGLPVYVLGETLNQGGMTYGTNPGRDDIGYRVFDIYIGSPGQGRYASDAELDDLCRTLDLPRVPVLYRGPCTPEAVQTYTNGTETVTGKGLHMREGVVIRPQIERTWFPPSGTDLRRMPGNRLQVKSVSPEWIKKYMSRRDSTDWN